MIRLFRRVAIFALLYVASGEAISFGLPHLIRWHFAYCMDNDSATCSASAAFLSYWWLAFLPVIVTATVLIDLAIEKRHAA